MGDKIKSSFKFFVLAVFFLFQINSAFAATVFAPNQTLDPVSADPSCSINNCYINSAIVATTTIQNFYASTTFASSTIITNSTSTNSTSTNFFSNIFSAVTSTIQSLILTGSLTDSTGNIGTSGQVLSSTGTSTKWVNVAVNSTTTTNNLYASTTYSSTTVIQNNLSIGTTSNTIVNNSVFSLVGSTSSSTSNILNIFNASGTSLISVGGNGGLTIASATPVSTVNTLYNLGGVIYWNGNSLGGNSLITNSTTTIGGSVTNINSTSTTIVSNSTTTITSSSTNITSLSTTTLTSVNNTFNASTTNINSSSTTITGTTTISNLVVGNLTGFLKATAGVITATLINLGTDVSGILGIANGGTGTSTIPSYGQILVGNNSNGYDLVSTSTLLATGNLIVNAGASNVATSGSGKVIGGDLTLNIGTGNITSPSNPEITISGGTNSVLGAGVTITIPDANSTTRGLVTIGAQNFSGIKTFVNGFNSSATSSMSGVLNMNSNYITNLANPVNSNDAANKSYVDASVAGGVALTPAISISTTSAPGSPTTGDRYLIESGQSGFGSCINNNVVQWSGAAWVCTTAATGTSILINNTSFTYKFDGSNWIQTTGAISVSQLTGKQGGDGSNYYFLGQSDYNNLTSGSAQLAQLKTTGTPNFTGINISGTSTLNGLSYIFPATQAPNTVLSTNGSGILSWITALTANLATGAIFVGNGAGQAAAVNLNGDATINSTGALTLANSGVVAGTYGSTTTTGVAVLTVDSKGRITTATNTSNLFGMTLNGTTTANKITGLISPTSNSDAANKSYVDALIQGLSWQNPVINFINITVGSSTNDRYIISTTTNIGMSPCVINNICQNAGNGIWVATAPATSTTVYVTGLSTSYTFNGSSWVSLGSSIQHNSLVGLQGGNGSSEEYHLTFSQWDNVTTTTAQLANLRTVGAPTFAGLVLTGNATGTNLIFSNSTSSNSQLANLSTSNLTASGTISIIGTTTLATTTFQSAVNFNNVLILASSTSVSTTSLALYNNNGLLYWNGAAVSTGTSANGTTGNIQVSDGSGGFTSSSAFKYSTSTNTLTIGPSTSPIRLFSTTTNALSTNLYLGQDAGTSTTLGTANTGFGFDSLYNITSGNGNTSFGSGALTLVSTGYENTSMGASALGNAIGASTYNVAIGYASGGGFGTYSNNTSIGTQANAQNIGNNNVIVGYSAGSNLINGSSNIIIGNQSMAPTTTSNNILNIGNIIYGTGLTATGTNISNGGIGIGTTTNIYGGNLTQGLTLNNSLVLASSTALSTTSLALYNNNGTLYWNGAAVGVGGNTLPASTTSLYVDANGSVSVGMTTNIFGGLLTTGMSLNNSLVLASSTALSTSTYAIYNNNGTLYWNGNALSSEATATPVIGNSLTLSQSFGSSISAVVGSSTGFTNFTGGIGTGGADSVGGPFNGALRLTNTGNLVNIGSIQAGSLSMSTGGTFAAKTDYYTNGAGPKGVAIGDFNGDGKPDMVVANYSSSTISVYINNGSGLFTASTTYATGGNPEAVTVGDFNGDGKADIALVDDNFHMSVFKNNGYGQFPNRVDYGANLLVYGVTTGDINGDGRTDIITANFGAGGASVYINQGNGVFASKADYSSGGGQTSEVAVGDFNGDGKPDIAYLATGSHTMTVAFNNGNGGFGTATSYAAGTIPEGIAVGDVNGDGKLDIVNGGGIANNVKVFTNNGDGTFTGTTYAVTNQPQDVALADVNGDGKLDIVATNLGGTTVSVLLNNGNGTFASKVDYTVGSQPYSVALGDLNGDGKPDIVAVNYASNTVSVLMNNVSPSLYVSGSTGFVGIGTTSPSFALDVVGATSSNVARFSSHTGTFTCTLTSANGIIACTSDRSLKENIASIDSTSSLNSILQLKPSSYNWIASPELGTQYGFIAQDVQQVLPQLVATDTDSGKLTLSQLGMIPFIVGAIKEIHNMLTDGFSKIFASEITAKDKLCVGQTCVTEDQLKTLLQNNNITPTQNTNPPAVQTATDTSTTTQTNIISNPATDTATTTQVDTNTATNTQIIIPNASST